MVTGTAMSQSSVKSDAEQVIVLFFPGIYILGQLCHMWQGLAPLHSRAVSPVLGMSLPFPILPILIC